MKTILAVETSTPVCSVALIRDSQYIYRQSDILQQHAALVLPMIDGLLGEARLAIEDIDCFAFGKGPGSFTGNRIACSIIQGLAYGCNKPVIGVSTLQAMAQASYRIHRVTNILAALDARKQQLYWGIYKLENGLLQAVIPDQLSDPENITALDEVQYAIGQGCLVYPEVFKQIILPEQYPSAIDIGLIAEKRLQSQQGDAPQQALPMYLRNNVVG